MVIEAQEALGREPNQDEKDHMLIMKLTHSYGYVPTCKAYDVQDIHRGLDRRTVRIARTGNPIDWQTIGMRGANTWIGFIGKPDLTGGIVQFIGERVYRLPLTVEQIGKALLIMPANVSMLEAVEQVLEVPLSPIQRSVINKVMKN